MRPWRVQLEWLARLDGRQPSLAIHWDNGKAVAPQQCQQTSRGKSCRALRFTGLSSRPKWPGQQLPTLFLKLTSWLLLSICFPKLIFSHLLHPHPHLLLHTSTLIHLSVYTDTHTHWDDKLIFDVWAHFLLLSVEFVRFGIAKSSTAEKVNWKFNDAINCAKFSAKWSETDSLPWAI